MKVCVVCRQEKPLSAFYGHKTSKDGHGYRCKVCDCAARKKSRNGPGGEKTRRNMRSRKLESKYGITQDDYERMLNDQDGGCAICGTDNPYGEGNTQDRASFSFAVDHCHETSRVRGLLCNTCNRALGFMRDNPQTLRAGALYLEKHGAGCH